MLIKVTAWIPCKGSWSTSIDTSSGYSAYVAAQLMLNRLIYAYQAGGFPEVTRPRHIKQIYGEIIPLTPLEEQIGRQRVQRPAEELYDGRPPPSGLYIGLERGDGDLSPEEKVRVASCGAGSNEIGGTV